MSEGLDPNTPPAPVEGAPALPGTGSPLGVPVGGDTSSGASTESGGNSDSSVSGEAGADSLSGEAGADSITSATYDDLVIPDGVTVDDETMTAFKEFGVANRLPKEAAQGLIDMHIAQLNKTAEAFAKGQADAWNATTTTWKTELESDPDLGGDKMKVVQADIGAVLDEYGSPEVRQAFDLTGAGWNPAIVRMMANIAKVLKEGTSLPPGNPQINRTRTPANILYPDAS